MKLIKILLIFLPIFIFLFRNPLRTWYNNLAYELPELRNIRTILKISDLVFLPYFLKRGNLGTIYIKADDKKLQQALQKIPRVEADVVFSKEDRDWIPIELNYRDKKYKAEMRLKGIGAIHWRDSKKSWKARLKNGILDDMIGFDLILPEDRGIVIEQLSNILAQKLNLPVVKSKFVNIVLNQNLKTTYFLIEELSSHALLKSNLPISSIFAENDKKIEGKPVLFEDANYWSDITNATGSSSFTAKNTLRELIYLVNHPEDQKLKRIEKVLDIENLISWQMHSMLLSSRHQEKSMNNRVYFNPLLNKFQYIPWDIADGLKEAEDVFTTLYPDYNPVVNMIFNNSCLKEKRNQKLKTLIFVENIFDFLLENYDRIWNEIRIDLYQDTAKFLTNWDIRLYAQKHRQRIERQRDILKTLLAKEPQYVCNE